MVSKEKNIFIYQTAYNYLLSILPDGIKDFDGYFSAENKEIKSLEYIFEILIQSAQEYQRMPNVIQFINRRDEIKEILYGFDFRRVADCNPEKLYYTFRHEFNVTSKDTPQNLWNRWTYAVVDSAKFVSQFNSVDDFKDFVSLFDYNSTTRMALPLVISTKIKGVGFALACNFLKELGYVNYPKPDVHITDTCTAFGLSDENQYSVFEAIVQMAEDNGESPYKVDKVLWLICSGFFHNDDIKIGRHKEEFISLVKEEMEKKFNNY